MPYKSYIDYEDLRIWNFYNKHRNLENIINLRFGLEEVSEDMLRYRKKLITRERPTEIKGIWSHIEFKEIEEIEEE